MQRSKLYGVELDSISGRIAKQLYQNANISITGFENTTYPDNFFDVVVGNVPFGDYKVFDPKYNKYNFRIHDYFLAKALDQVRPGGMVAVITTKGTLDKANPTIRKYMAERAELVGAIRLPNTAFKDNAGTEVTADILFLQKRERKIDIEPDWVHLGVTENGIAVNSYFAEHPEMMLGVMEYDTRIYGQDSRYTVCVNNDENFNMYEALNKAIGNIKAQMTDFERVADEAEQMEEVIPADPDVRNYTYTFYEGKLYYRENSEMVRKEVSQTAEERIRSLDEIRQITRELIDIQMDGCSEEELSDNQRLLNVKYDAFIKQYGAITSKANRIAFRDDSDYPLLCSLEEVNEDGEVKKADMFYKQTIKAKTVIDRVETAVEALNVSVNELLKKNAMKEQAMKNIHSNIEKDEKEIERIKKYIADLSKDVTSNYNSAYVRQLDERERELNARISELQQAEELAKKRDTLVSEVTSLRNQVESLKIKVDVFLNSAKEDMLNKKKDFDEIYSDLMQRADGQCYSAYIGEDYLPHINMGQYRERSASVPKRLMYFLTLLIESLKNDINFPRFLMIDTPNKEGIDKDNLIKNIALLTEADKYNYENKCPFQIILTTGIDTYPEDYKKFVFFKLEGEKYLLQENILEEKC